MTLLIISFIAGVLTVLAPCVLPLLPVILAGSVSETKNRRRPLIIILSLAVSVFAFTLLLKGSTALITVSPSFWSYISAIIFAVFGLTLLFPVTWAKIMLKVPGHNKPDAWMSKGYQHQGSFWADVLVGAALGPVFTTCSPTFFVILATVLPESIGMGLIDLAAYIIGLSLVLLLISWIGQKLVDRLEWATNPMGWFKRTLGVIFIILAILIAFGLDKKIESDILASGFFDVTNIEQAIHQALQGPTSIPQQPDNSNPVASTTPSQTSNPSGTSVVGSQDTFNATAVERDEGKYVEIKDPAGFVNSAPFKLADLVGKKVILIDFVDYSCINCERTFPYLNDWYSKYKDQGLEIVAIHTPEFAFEQDIKNVQAAAKQFRLTFPIVLDNSYSTWRAYSNQYWPHKYLIDIHGRVIYDHIGEGGYDETEQVIVHELNVRKQFLGESGTVILGKTLPAQAIQTQSPETYFGSERNVTFGNGAPGRSGQGTFAIPAALDVNTFYLGGTWNIQSQYAEAKSASSTISFIFNAAHAYIVAALAPGVSSVDAKVLIDGKPITAAQSGTDVKNGMLHIDSSRLYGIYSSQTMAQHRIDLIFTKPGVEAFTFTFG